MPHFVGLDAGTATTRICILDATGQVAREGTIETQPRAIIAFLRGERRQYRRIGLESMAMAAWLYEGLVRAALPVVCIEARHAQRMLSARMNKTDRNDAHGIAEIMRTGLYKAVHVKTRESQASRVLLTTRKLLKDKCRDLDNLIRGLLIQFGLKLSAGQPTTFERRARMLAAKKPQLKAALEATLAARSAITSQINGLEKVILKLVDDDPVCVRLMTVPGVGPLTALGFRTAIDVPQRFRRSRDVGVHLGLTPRTYQSGVTERRGRISRCGDDAARAGLFLAARSLLSKRTHGCYLKTWGIQIAARRGYLKAVVAVARRLAVTMHKMWITETDFRREIATG